MCLLLGSRIDDLTIIKRSPYIIILICKRDTQRVAL